MILVCSYTMLPTSYTRDVLSQLKRSGISLSALILSLLSDPEFITSDELSGLTEHIDAIFAACSRHVRLSRKTYAWAAATMTNLCTREISALTSKAGNMHFNARRATSERLEEFELVKLMEKMSKSAPYLWQFLGSCLEAQPLLIKRRKNRRRRRQQRRQRPRKVPTPPRRVEEDAGSSDEELWRSFPEPAGADIAMDVDELADSDSEDEYWDSMEPIDVDDLDDLEGEAAEEEEEDRWARIHRMVSEILCSAPKRSTDS